VLYHNRLLCDPKKNVVLIIGCFGQKENQSRGPKERDIEVLI